MSALPPAVRRACLRLALCTALAPAVAAAQNPFTSLTVFGDSFSDTGNIFAATGGAIPPSPPYYNGRFSNGPIWVDDFAAALGLRGGAAPVFLNPTATTGNYALGGARTQSVSGYPVPGTDTQINTYLSRTGKTTDATGLYVLFAGANDLRDIGGIADPTLRQQATAAAALRVVAQADSLAKYGARNVLLFSLPSLAITPEARAVPGLPAIDDALAATFNSTLGSGIAGLQGSFVNAKFLDLRLDNLLYNVLADARTGGARYGLTNLTVPCLPPPAGPGGAPSCGVSVFADSLHPTAAAHQLVANAAYTYVTTGVNVAAVPEPATFALVGGGLGAIVLVRTRRRAGRSVSHG